MLSLPQLPQSSRPVEPVMQALPRLSFNKFSGKLASTKFNITPHKIIRVFRGLIVVLWFLFCVLPFVVLQFIYFPILRRLNKNLLEIATQLLENLFGYFIAGTMNLYCPHKLVFTGKKSDFNYFRPDSSIDWFKMANLHGAVLMSNHQIYADWLYLWALGYYYSFAHYIKFVAKYEISKIPIFGRALGLIGTVFLKRQWELDKPLLQSSFDEFKRSDNKKILIIFPEGTTVNPKFIKKSDEFADINNLKKTNHVLIPKTSGTFFCIQALKDKMPYLYDLTIAYSGLSSNDCPEYSYPLTRMFTRIKYPKEIHINISRYSITSQVPLEEEIFSEWLIDKYHLKDTMLDFFYKNNHFPHDPAFYSQNIDPKLSNSFKSHLDNSDPAKTSSELNSCSEIISETIIPSTSFFILKALCIISAPYSILYLHYFLFSMIF
ncbi:hypothetical protein BB561_000489 [Smittium simulii]|uniref:Phospholipid/glycerol acyltransferase domain-containing protein n=1 Tax=Smittium simulii TaxID=133385 RepID=A0A2T9YYX9_9FUNG|nr:hypothetical protein BB561_000489 [Smittium simulii]